jgi:Domain of unknown function (DUF4249)
VNINSSKNLILVIFLSACLQPVEIVTDREGGNVVVSGQLSNLADQSVVHVGITADKERLPFPISGAVVNLFEEDELAGIYIEDDTRPGKYILENYSGTPGKTYHVEVLLPDNRTYKSVPEKMPDDSGSLSTYYKIEREEFTDYEGLQVQQTFVKIFANSILPAPSNRFIMWTVDEVFIIFGGSSGPVTPPPCFVTQNADPQFVVTLDRQNLLAKEYPDQFLARRLVDYTFMFRHYFVTYQTSLTGQAFDYWTKVKILASQNGSLFDTPPAIISGNISNTRDKSERVFGYFQAVHQTLHRVLLTKDDFPYPLNFTDCITSSSPNFSPPQRCIDCLSVANSSHIKPPWF